MCGADGGAFGGASATPGVGPSDKAGRDACSMRAVGAGREVLPPRVGVAYPGARPLQDPPKRPSRDAVEFAQAMQRGMDALRERQRAEKRAASSHPPE